MSKHWWITGCKIGEALADSSSLIFLFCRGENWGLKRGSPSSYPRIRTLREQPPASCTQMGDFCCKCTPLSKSPILTRLFSCKESPFSCFWEVVGRPWLSRVFRESLMVLGKAATDISNVLLNILDPRAGWGQAAVSRAHAGTLTSSQCNDSKSLVD